MMAWTLAGSTASILRQVSMLHHHSIQQIKKLSQFSWTAQLAQSKCINKSTGRWGSRFDLWRDLSVIWFKLWQIKATVWLDSLIMPIHSGQIFGVLLCQYRNVLHELFLQISSSLPGYLIYFTTTITNEIINLSKKVVPRIKAEERGSRRVLFFQVEPFSHGSLASNFRTACEG